MYKANPDADLKRALKALQDKQADAAHYLAAYNGELPLRFLAEKLREISKELRVSDVRENWASIVIDACADKITLTGLDVEDETQQDALNDLIAQTELLLEADDAHKHSLIAGQSFIVAWKDEDSNEVDLFYHKAFSCHVFHDADNPNRPIFAAKWWDEASDSEADKYHVYIKLYYADVLVCYKTKATVESLQDVKFDNLVQDDEAKNPFGVIPVFAFQPDRRDIVSDLRDVIPAQNTINMLSVNEVVSSEFNAYGQKYIISNAGNIGSVKSSPRSILDIPAAQEGEQNTEVGEFGATDLSNYGKAIERRIQGIAASTRTPLHYFFASGGTPSGEALIALEAPLNHKAQDRIDRFTVTWKKLAVFLLQLAGTEGVLPKDITPQFKKPETVQPRTYAEIFKMYHDAEIPLEANLRREGMPQEEIDRITEEAAETKRENIANAVASFNAGTDDTTPQPPIGKKKMPPNANGKQDATT